MSDGLPLQGLLQSSTIRPNKPFGSVTPISRFCSGYSSTLHFIRLRQVVESPGPVLADDHLPVKYVRCARS